MSARAALLRSSVESALAGRVPAPFTYRDHRAVEIVPTGTPEIDLLTGGLPRGGLIEICGPPCSGRTSLLVSALASRTAEAESCALVDGRDSFDPCAAQTAGVRLQNLLWVRCKNIDQAMRATDLLLQSGGFGMVAVDLSDLPPKTVRYVPLNAWFRFRRVVEDTPTILLVLGQESNAKTCASLVLRTAAREALWATACEPAIAGGNFVTHPVSRLLNRFSAHAEVLRSRIQRAEIVTFSRDAAEKSGRAANFTLETRWGYPGGPPLETQTK